MLSTFPASFPDWAPDLDWEIPADASGVKLAVYEELRSLGLNPASPIAYKVMDIAVNDTEGDLAMARRIVLGF
jgi:hypothetical protein